MLENGEPFGTMSFSITVPAQGNDAFRSGAPEHKGSVTVKGTQGSGVHASSNTASVSCFLWNFGQISWSLPHARSTYLLNTSCVSKLSHTWVIFHVIPSFVELAVKERWMGGGSTSKDAHSKSDDLSSVLWIHMVNGDKTNS